jgi:hypothetical protein
MANTEAVKEPDIKAVAADRGERTALMEPLVLSEGSPHRPGLTDLAVELAQRLTEHGVLISQSSRSPLRLAFPAALASRWMPGLFPDRA